MDTSREKSIDEINADYSAGVARRKQEQERREVRAKARNLAVQRFNAVLQIPVCIGFIIFSIVFYAQNINAADTFQTVMLTVGLVICQASGWTYIVCFPWFYRSLR